MNKEELKKFLTEKSGYLKSSSIRIQKMFEKKNIWIPLYEIKEAIKEVKNEIQIKKLKQVDLSDIPKEMNLNTYTHGIIGPDSKPLQKNIKDEIPKGFKVKSKWQNAKGEWLQSLEAIEDKEEDTLLDDIKNIIKKETSLIHLHTPTNLNYNNLDLKVWTSDKHIGACTKDSMFDNYYSAKEFEIRMDKIYEGIKNQFNKNGVFSCITIGDLGDAIDGMDGYTVSRSHQLPQNLNNKEAFKVYFEVHKKFIEKLMLSGFANNYNYWMITNSNHGGDFEYTAHMALKYWMEIAYPEIKVKTFDNFINHIYNNGICYILTHGKDKKNRKFGLPMYPDAKLESFIVNYMKMNNIPLEMDIRIIKGDLHVSNSCDTKIGRYRNVASVFGSSGWVMDNYGFTQPGCDYEILDLDSGEIYESKFKL